MTNPFNARFDAMAHKALKRAGLADGDADAAVSDVFYTPDSGGPEVPCRILIDRGLQLQSANNSSAVINDAVTIECYAADVGAAPKPGARFRIGTEFFTVDALAAKDESRYVCVVKAGY